MKKICCEEQGGVLIYWGNLWLRTDGKMIQNGAKKAEVWNVSVLSVVTVLMAFFSSRS